MVLLFSGLNDREREGQYKWADGSEAIDQEFRWLPGEPANSPPGEDCVEMYTRTNQFLWNDVPCSDELSFVCQVGRIFISLIYFAFCLEAATRGVLRKKAFLEISEKSQENTCARVSFLIKFLRAPFLQNTSGRLLLFCLIVFVIYWPLPNKSNKTVREWQISNVAGNIVFINILRNYSFRTFGKFCVRIKWMILNTNGRCMDSFFCR